MGGIPDIRINGQSIQTIENIGVNGTGINFIGTKRIYDPNIKVIDVNNNQITQIADTRICWEIGDKILPIFTYFP